MEISVSANALIRASLTATAPATHAPHVDERIVYKAGVLTLSIKLLNQRLQRITQRDEGGRRTKMTPMRTTTTPTIACTFLLFISNLLPSRICLLDGGEDGTTTFPMTPRVRFDSNNNNYNVEEEGSKSNNQDDKAFAGRRERCHR